MLPEHRRNPLYASTFLGFRPVPNFGAVPHDRVRPAILLAHETSLGLSYTLMPLFPQLLMSRGNFFVGTDSGLYTVTSPVGSVIPAAISVVDGATLAAGTASADTIATGGGQWDCIDHGDFRLFNNRENLIFRHPLIDPARYGIFKRGDSCIPSSTIFHKGRYISCGYGGTNYWSSTMAEVWNRLTKEGSTWGYGLTAAGPGDNWVGYSSFGVFDYLYHRLSELALKSYGSHADVTRVPDITTVELISNGGFDSATGWSLGTGWTVAGGLLVATAASGNASQASTSSLGPLKPNTDYVIRFTVSGYVAGDFTVQIDNIAYFEAIDANGEYAVRIRTANTLSTNVVILFNADGLTCNIDDVSVLEYESRMLGFQQLMSDPAFDKNPLEIVEDPITKTVSNPSLTDGTGTWDYNSKTRWIRFTDAAEAGLFTQALVIQENLLFGLVEGATYRIRFAYRITHDDSTSTPVVEVAFGDSTILTVNGTAGARTDVPIIFDEEVVYTSGLLAESLRFVPQEDFSADEIFLLYGVSITAKMETAHGNAGIDDVSGADPFLMELVRRNEAGFIPMPFQGEALRLRATENHIFVFGEDGVAALKPMEDRSLALAFMQQHDEISKTGIKERSAVTGDEQSIFFIDRFGILWEIADNLQTTRLGGNEFFYNMSSISMTFDPNTRRVRICGIRNVGGTSTPVAYMLSDGRLSEMTQHVSSAYREDGCLVGFAQNRAVSYTLGDLRTSFLDFGYRGVKEINSVQLHGVFGGAGATLGALIVPPGGSKPVEVVTVYGSPERVYHPNVAADQIMLKIYGDNILSQPVVNGDFASSASWTAGSGWTIGSGVASHSGSGTAVLSQTIAIAEGLYLLQYEITAYTSGTVTPILGGTYGITRSRVGVYQEQIQVTGDDLLIQFLPGGTFVGSIDNVVALVLGMAIQSLDVMLDYADSRSIFSGHRREFTA